MTDEDALLAAIIADPDDDLPRLVYADWLDEHDQPDRAEFIRLQIERANAPPGSATAKRCFGCEAELLARHWDEWAGPFKPWAGFGDLLFRRGFVEQLTCDAGVFVENSAPLFRLSPVREIWFRQADEVLPRLVRIPRPPGVRFRVGHEYPGWVDGEELVDLLPLRPLVTEPYLLRGSWLVLAYGTYSVPDVQTAHRFLTYVRGHFGRGRQTLNFGIRPLDDPPELTTWCALPNPFVTPRWVWLDDGQCIRTQTGIEPPAEWRDHWAMT
jgi:uncharacterized protein (TIGR02996 family)